MESQQIRTRIDIKYAYYVVSASFICFLLIKKCVSYVGPPKSVVGRHEIWKWNNLVTSWIHAVVCAVWNISCFYFYPELVYDLIHQYSMYQYLHISMTVGYFIYDFWDMYNNRELRDQWEVAIHHIMVLTSLGYHLIHCLSIAWTAVLLLTEINTVFLHSRKLLQMTGISFDHRIYRISVWLNLLSFVAFRFGPQIWLAWGFLYHQDQVPPFYYYGVFCPCWLVLSTINPILFVRLVKNDVLRPVDAKNGVQKPHTVSKGASSNNNVANHLSDHSICNGKKQA